MRAVTGALVAGAVLLVAASPDPVAAVKARQARMKDVGRTFKTINDQMKSGSPDANVVKANARKLALLTANVAPLFQQNTTGVTGMKIEAKPEIWSHWADFQAKAGNLAQATRQLAATADRSTDPAVLGPAVKTVGGACKACHDSYRLKD